MTSSDVLTKSPKAFLCHATEDIELARRVAHSLQRDGVDTFFSEWSIGAGDSIRQRIDEGLGGCTHFVVLLTESSINKPWVNAEIDGAFMRKVQGECQLLPVRYNLDVNRLPPLLRRLLSPKINDLTYEQDMRMLTGTIYGVSRKPPLGQRPEFTRLAANGEAGLSVAAGKIAAEIVRRSELGRAGDPRIEVAELMSWTGLGEEGFEVAVDELELRSLVKSMRAAGSVPFGYLAIAATTSTFIELDPVFMKWHPSADAVSVATDLMNSDRDAMAAEELSESLGWPPRRLNPALSYLIREQAVLGSGNVSARFVTSHIQKNNRTLAFVREMS